jgi:uncharacterized protein (DUF3084 family)
MSTIGKIFLVLNLVLAGAFVGWAANSIDKTAKREKTHADAVAQMKAEKDGVDKELSEARAALTTERTAKDQTRAERDQFESESKRNKEDLEAARRANDGLRADVAKINETMGGLNTQLQSIEAAKTAAMNEAREMATQRDDAKRKADAEGNARREADENLAKANMEIASLEKQLKSTKDELASTKTSLDSMVATYGINRGEGEAVPEINAQVVKADYSLKPGLVALNVGSNQKVKAGYVFEIYAGGVYKGQVRVETVHADMCSALITFAQSGTTMTSGDSATTRL